MVSSYHILHCDVILYTIVVLNCIVEVLDNVVEVVNNVIKVVDDVM